MTAQSAPPRPSTATGAAPTVPVAAPGRRRATAIAGLLAAVAGLFLAALALGSVRIPLGDVVVSLLGGEPSRPVWATIVHAIRLPRAITALLAGMALGVSGLQMQTLFRNPLADPFVLGISSGASLGVALVVLGGWGAGTGFLVGLGLGGTLTVTVAASLGASAVMGLVLLLARRVNSIVTVLIIGIMVAYVANSVVSLLIYFGNSEHFREYIAWSLGSFRGVTWTELRVLVPALTGGLVIAWATAKQLNALLLGERYAESMGLSTLRARALTVGSASVLAGVVTAYAGPIAFVGLAVPHLARLLLRTSDHRVLLPACALVGAAMTLVAELVGQVPGQAITLPINAVTPLLGAPVVLAVLLRMRRSSQAVVT